MLTTPLKVLKGFNWTSLYIGYASTFKFAGDHEQKPLANKRSRVPSTLVAMDALHFHSGMFIHFNFSKIVIKICFDF